MTLLGRMLAALGFVVCIVAMTGACGSRATPAGGPVAPQAPAPPVPLPTTPEPAPPAAAPDPTPDSGHCALIGEPGEAIATVALTDRIDPEHAPYPSNESERLLFRQLYETLVRVDCDGHVLPGLASSWRLDAHGRTWIVALREDAQFSDGTPVTPLEVRASWSIDAVGEQLRPRVDRLVESVVPIDDRTLAITLRRPRVDAPLALAHTDLAIARLAADSPWPLGTSVDRTAPAHDASAATADSAITLGRNGKRPLRFLVAPGDPRDLLDRGVDLLLTRDPAALDYAATLPHVQSMPLEWQRTHVLLTPGRARTAPSLAEDARHALADDAVRGEARGAMGPFWWQMLHDCAVDPPQPRQQGSAVPQIVYDRTDGAARDLAERLVGLVRASGPDTTAILDVVLPDRPHRTYQRATGLTGEPLAAARRRGTDAGYIISLDRRPLEPCRDVQALTDDVRWLDPATIVPLVDTRLRAIVRRGRSGLTSEWDGGLLIADVSSPR